VRAGLVAALVIAAGCKDGGARRDGAAKPADRAATTVSTACARVLAAPPATEIDGGLGAVLAACTPCGVPWDPLIAVSAIDPDGPPPETAAPALPPPTAIFDVLDACRAPCSSSARAEVAELLRDADRTPSAPWRKLAERCPEALRVDAHTRRFARGTWYALARITAAIGTDEALAGVRRAPPEFPLPPLSEAATALALPRVDRLAPWHPRVHVTVTESMIQTGVLPWVELGDGGPSLVPGPGLDYPGDPVSLDAVARVVGEITAALAPSRHPADAEPRPLIVAPRGLAAARVLAVVARLPGRAYLAATPPTHAAPWPEPLGAIPIGFTVGATEAPRSSPTLVTVTLPATAKVADLAAALTALPPGVDTALIVLAPDPSP